MRIAIIVEGKTEDVFIHDHLKEYIETRLSGTGMPKLDSVPFDGRIPTGNKLKRVVEKLLSIGPRPADHVIALTDVYTGSRPPEFTNAADAKKKMRQWVGREERFHPHAAQYDFEAWLLPYWPSIQKLAGHNRRAPSGDPEKVNHSKPPAHRLQEIFRAGSKGKAYVKPRDAGRILRDNDLSTAVSQCAELRSLINTILTLSGAPPIS